VAADCVALVIQKSGKTSCYEPFVAVREVCSLETLTAFVLLFPVLSEQESTYTVNEEV